MSDRAVVCRACHGRKSVRKESRWGILQTICCQACGGTGMALEHMAAAYLRGASCRDIACETNADHSQVYLAFKRGGVPIRCRSMAQRLARGRKAAIDSTGYVRWGRHRVHQIVCRAWHGPPPTPAHEVNHIDGDKTNCHPDNLEWVTHAENLRHAYETGLMRAPPARRGEESHASKLTAADVVRIRHLWSEGWSGGRIAEQFNVSAHAIRCAATGRSWAHLPGAQSKRGEHPNDCASCEATARAHARSEASRREWNRDVAADPELGRVAR
jgi:hypothetical protein